jgi:hypothetical protein
VGRNGAARAARFAWKFSVHAGRPAWDQCNCVTARLARTLRLFRLVEAGSEADHPQRACPVRLRARPMLMSLNRYRREVVVLGMNGAGTARFISNLCREGVKPELDAPRAVDTD